MTTEEMHDFEINSRNKPSDIQADQPPLNKKPLQINQDSSNVTPNTHELRRQNKTVEKFMTALKLSRITIMICTLALLLGSIVMLVYLTVSVKSINQEFMLELFNDLAYEFMMSGFASRLLMLTNEGRSIYNAEEVRSMLSTSSDHLRDLLSDLQDSKATIVGYGFDKLYSNDFMRRWHLENGDPVMDTRTLVEVIEDFILNTSAASRLDIEECTLSNQYLYYNYRNGLGEAFTLMNSTAYEYIDKQNNFIGEVETNLQVISGVSGAVLAMCFALVIPSVVYLQRTYDKFWVQLAKLSVTKVQELKFEVVRRANSCFGPEIIEELENTYSMDFRKIRSGDKTLPKVRIVIWKKVAVKLSMFLALSGMLFAVFYSVCFVNIKDTLEIYYERVYVAYQIKVGFLSVTVWSEENNFMQPTLNTAVPSYMSPDGSLNLEDSIERFDYILLCTYDSKFENVNFDKKSMLREDFGSTNPYFHHGLQPAVIHFYQEFKAYQDKDIIYPDGELRVIIDISKELGGLEDEIVASISEATQVEVNRAIVEAESITICYAVGVLALSFAVYKHMFDCLGEKLRRNLGVIRLML